MCGCCQKMIFAVCKIPGMKSESRGGNGRYKYTK